MTRDYTATIIEPEIGKRINGKVLCWQVQHNDLFYAVMDSGGDYVAIRTDVYLSSIGHQWYEMRSVVLVEPNRPLAWEVGFKNRKDAWQPVEGQHLRPRTAPAEEWLMDVGTALNGLLNQHRDLVAERSILTRNLCPNHLNEPVAGSLQQGPLSPRTSPCENDLQDLTRVAKERVDGAIQSLSQHHLASQSIPRWNLPRRFSHWFQAFPLYWQLRKEKAGLKEAIQDMACLEHSGYPSENHDSVQTSQQQLRHPTVDTIDQELKLVTTGIRHANELTHYLQRNCGSPVTLIQTIVAERRAEILPTQPAINHISPHVTRSHRMRI